MFNRYYQEELSRLRKEAKRFSELHPALAPYLSGPSSDPDVERLLEGVAFLTGLLRQKIDDEFPEIIHELMELIWPHYLRPIPSAAIVAFRPKPMLKEAMNVPRGTKIASRPVDGTRCKFMTCFDITVHPLSVADAGLVESPTRGKALVLELELSGMTLDAWQPPERLEIFIGKELATGLELYHLLSRGVDYIEIEPAGQEGDGPRDGEEGNSRLRLSGKEALEPLGFSEKEALLPYPATSFAGYRILQEYFIQPEKFLFFSIKGLDRWRNRPGTSRFRISFFLNGKVPPPGSIGTDNFILSATPAVNIFPCQAEPIVVDHRQTRYKLRVNGINPEHYMVYSVEEVTGFIQGTAVERRYAPFELFGTEEGKSPVFNIIRRPSILGPGVDVFITLAYPEGTDLVSRETLSIEMMCTNGFLPEQLQLGDICMPTSETPELIEFANVTLASPCALPPLGKDLLWRLVSHLNLNYVSLADAKNLKALLRLYIFTETRNKKGVMANEKRIEAIEEIEFRPVDRLMHGIVMRGQEIEIKMRQDHFINAADLFLFATILDYFLGSYASINSFTMLKAVESFSGESISWPPRTGQRPLL